MSPRIVTFAAVVIAVAVAGAATVHAVDDPAGDIDVVALDITTADVDVDSSFGWSLVTTYAGNVDRQAWAPIGGDVVWYLDTDDDFDTDYSARMTSSTFGVYAGTPTYFGDNLLDPACWSPFFNVRGPSTTHRISDGDCLGNPTGVRFYVEGRYWDNTLNDFVVDRVPDSGWSDWIEQPPAPDPNPAAVISVEPARLYDSRPGGDTIDGRDIGAGRRPAGSVTRIDPAGRGPIPADIAGVVVNVTAVQPAGIGYVTVWPCWTEQPNASNLNYTPGRTTANTTIVNAGDTDICVYTHTDTHLVVDVTGYLARNSTVRPRSPQRLVDTRAGGTTIDRQQQGSGPVAAGTTFEIVTWGRGGVFADDHIFNITAVAPQASGFLTVWPCGTPRPNSSNVNYTAGVNVANLVISRVTNGRVCVYTSATTHLVVDRTAVLGPSGRLTTIEPRRLTDTRPDGITFDGADQNAGRIRGGTTHVVDVAGRGNTPGNTDAAIVNLTAVQPAGVGFLTAYPCGTTPPNSSNVNYQPGSNTANAAIIELGDGDLCVYTSADVDLVVDLVGWTI